MTSAGTAPGLRWQVLVDWTGGGVWGAANVDISGDVVGLRWQAGRRGQPVPEFAPPATLELSLRNTDGRYTPGNGASALAGLVQPGREVWLRAAWLYDDFADGGGGAGDGDGNSNGNAGATASNLDGRIAGGVGIRWQVAAPAGNGFTVQSGEVRGTAGRGRPADAVATLDAADPLATLIVRYRRGSNGRGGLALRCAAADDCLRLRFGSAATILERVNGRRVTRLAAGAALTAGQWHELEIRQTDATVQVFATNLDASGLVRRELLAADGIADAPDSGRHGLWNGFRNTADRWGDFSAGRSLYVGRIGAIEPEYRPGICRITAVDVMGRLDGIRLFRLLSAGRMTTGAVAASILGWAGLAAAEYQADAGRLLRSGGPRAVWEVTAGQALRRLQREENGLLYADGLGRVRLESASARAAIRSNPAPTALAKFAVADTAGDAGSSLSSSSPLSSSPYAAGREWSDNAGAVESPITFRYRRATDHGRQQIWSLNEPLDVPPGGSRTLSAVANAWDAITDVAAPVANTDYRATVDAAGIGADATASIRVALLPESESGMAGRGVALRVSNRGAQTAYVQRLRLYAAHCWRADSATAYAKSATDGVGAGADDAGASGGPAARTVECRYADHYAAAQDGAESRFAERGRRRAQMELTLPLAAIANRRAAVEGQMSDVIAAAAPSGGDATAWFLEGMEVAAGAGAPGWVRWWLTEV